MPHEAHWKLLTDELDSWSNAGRVASMWWRDDDAVTDTAALRRLLDITNAEQIPLAIAVVPARIQTSLPKLLETYSTVSVLPHGLSHQNNAPAAEKKSEFGPSRDMQAAKLELRRARVLIDSRFGDKALPVLVPPWNRIAEACISELPGSGFTGLSCFGARQAAEPTPGLMQANCHVDVIDWRGSRGFVGVARALDDLIGHLRARRLKSVDESEPSGVLSHHLVHDIACWDFLEALIARLSKHPGQRWISVAQWLHTR